MNYKVYVYLPDDEELIAVIIEAAASAGAGRIGNYSHCAFIHKGWGQWKTLEGATPHLGAIGEVTRIDEVKVEMRCPVEKAREVRTAIEAVHPFEEVSIEFLKLEEI